MLLSIGKINKGRFKVHFICDDDDACDNDNFYSDDSDDDDCDDDDCDGGLMHW